MATAESAMSQRFFTDPPRGVLRIGPRARGHVAVPVSCMGGRCYACSVKRLPTPSRQSLHEMGGSDDPFPVEPHFSARDGTLLHPSVKDASCEITATCNGRCFSF